MKRTAILIISSLLFGCATVTKPVPLDPKFWQNKDQTIGVAVTKSEPPTAYMLGNQGLLDIVINRANASQLIDHLAKLKLPKLEAIANDFITQLKARGFNVKLIEQAIDESKQAKFSGSSSETVQYPKYDYRKYKADGFDRLLIVSVDRVGTTRNYYGFLPTSAPQADFALRGQLVNLDTNELLWYTNDTSHLPIADPWDQPPSFENVTAAVNTNVDQGIEKMEQSFFSGPVQ